MSSKRIVWVDIARGIAMIFVMMGHASGIPKSLMSWVYSFHMPLFFFLSGYVFNVEKYHSFKSLLIDKSRTLLFPMVALSTVLSIWTAIINTNYGISGLIKHFIGIFIELRGSDFDSGLWFITCLFVIELLWWFLCKISAFNSIIKKIIVLFVFSVIGFLYVVFIDHIVPWALEASLISIGFFGVGNLIKKNGERIIQWIEKKKIILCIVSLAINCMVVFFNIIYNFEVDIYADNLGFYPLFYIGAFSGILFSIALSMQIEVNKALTFIGRNSFIYYAFHKVLYATFDKILLIVGIVSSQSINWWLYIIISCFILWIVSNIINRYMPWMLGRFKSVQIAK